MSGKILGAGGQPVSSTCPPHRMSLDDVTIAGPRTSRTIIMKCKNGCGTTLTLDTVMTGLIKKVDRLQADMEMLKRRVVAGEEVEFMSQDGEPHVRAAADA